MLPEPTQILWQDCDKSRGTEESRVTEVQGEASHRETACDLQASSHVKSYTKLHMWTSHVNITCRNIICEHHMWTSHTETSHVNISKFTCEIIFRTSHVDIIYGISKKMKNTMTTHKSHYHMWTSYVSFTCDCHVLMSHVKFTYKNHMWTSHVKITCRNIICEYQ